MKKIILFCVLSGLVTASWAQQKTKTALPATSAPQQVITPVITNGSLTPIVVTATHAFNAISFYAGGGYNENDNYYVSNIKITEL